ncbi:MAG TPA: hypothetical protein DDZ80_09720 [Cyanobacteria bacterium UBA8803]|nr:hypothetical protein [Cyanobacteria bacterium UBA9273]HBL58773.1 hypothetical protein [Cyanobacteria bacterium UBA8803]
MAWFTRSSRLTILTAALTLGLAVNLPSQVQAQLRTASLGSQLPDRWEFTAPRGPNGESPVNRDSGGTRSPNNKDCIPETQLNPSVLALAPSGTGTTAAEYPTISWYMPATRASQVNFVLKDANQRQIYSATYTLAKSARGFTPSGIMSLTLPAFTNLSPLKIGEDYHWEVALNCNDPTDSSDDIVVEGWIQRVAPNPTLASEIQRATPQKRVALYAKEQLWYETVKTLAELQRNSPEDPEVVEAWNKLLKSVGLKPIFSAPERNTLSGRN